MKRFITMLLLMWLPFAIASAPPPDAEPAELKRSSALAAQLRCLVCQNQSIAESDAELAVDLRRQIDEQIRAGRSDREIIGFMTDRYGDFVLYRPPLNAQTLLLWGGPALLALLALAVFGRTLMARRRRIVERPLTDAERAEAERLLAQAPGTKDLT